MAAHHHTQIHAGKRFIVQIRAHESLGDEPRRRGKARRVVIDHQVVVDGLGNMDAAQRIIRVARRFRDDAHRIGAVIAADIEKGADAMGLHRAEDLLAIGAIRLVAGRAQGRGRRIRHLQQVLFAFFAQVDKVLVDDAANPVKRAIDGVNAGMPPGFQHDACQRLVDHGGGPAALGDQDLAELGSGHGG